jgi:hypothetical protein
MDYDFDPDLRSEGESLPVERIPHFNSRQFALERGLFVIRERTTARMSRRGRNEEWRMKNGEWRMGSEE